MVSAPKWALKCFTRFSTSRSDRTNPDPHQPQPTFQCRPSSLRRRHCGQPISSPRGDRSPLRPRARRSQVRAAPKQSIFLVLTEGHKPTDSLLKRVARRGRLSRASSIDPTRRASVRASRRADALCTQDRKHLVRVPCICQPCGLLRAFLGNLFLAQQQICPKKSIVRHPRRSVRGDLRPADYRRIAIHDSANAEKISG